MSDPGPFEHFGKDKIFELVFIRGGRQAFYRVKPYVLIGDTCSLDYRFTRATTPQEAVRMAVVELVKRRFTDD